MWDITCPTDKTGLGYVPPSTFDTPSTSKTIFMKPVIFESPPPYECIREKQLWKEKFQLSLSHKPSLLSEESLLLAITVVSSSTSDLSAHIGKLRERQIGRLLKLPCVTKVDLAVMSGLGVLHLKRSHPGIMDLLP